MAPAIHSHGRGITTVQSVTKARAVVGTNCSSLGSGRMWFPADRTVRGDRQGAGLPVSESSPA
jgi:hypothetical protein